MNKTLYILTVIIIIFSFYVSAEPINVLLEGPKNEAEIITYTQDFMFGFNQDVEIFNCSLIVDDEAKGFRNILIKRTNNKITLELEAGTHIWSVECYDTDYNIIFSETRTLTVNVGEEIKEGYEIIYYYTGLRAYVFTIAPGHSLQELPAMKAGEDIQIKIGKETHYIDILKMGASGDTTFVEVRDRTSGKIHRMLVSDTLSFDFDSDETVDIEILLKKVERNIDAYFVVTPYPGSALAPEEPTEEPETPIEPEPEPEPEEEVITVEEEPTQEKEEEVPVQEPEQEEEEPVITTQPVKADKSKTGLYLLIIAVVLVVILVIILLARKGGKKQKKIKKKQPKPAPAKKAEQKSIAKQKKQEPQQEDDFPILDKKENFDIIKTSGGTIKKR